MTPPEAYPRPHSTERPAFKEDGMRNPRSRFWLAGAVVLAGLVSLGVAGAWAGSAKPEWAMNATAIEACSCPMFCQCYFNTQPAGHHDMHGGGEKHFCRANLAYKVNKGHHGATSLDGAKFWMSNDLGGDFSKGQMDWNVLTFDKSLSQAQRDAIAKIVGHLFPVTWRSNTVAEGVIDRWEIHDTWAHATLDGGKTAEVKLVRPATANGAGPVVLSNLRYWGAPRNDGFILMPNEVEAYRVGPKAFEYKGTNGFLITVDINSNDVAPAVKGM
jgi:hypothetical protein